MELADLIEVHLEDGTVKECFIDKIETFNGEKGIIKKVLVKQRKFTVEEVKRFQK